MNAPYYDIFKYLSVSGIGLTAGDNLFAGAWGKPDNQVLVVDGVSIPPDIPSLYEPVGIQILVRGAKLEPQNAVYSKAYEIFSFMLSLSDNIQANGCEYKGFDASSNLAALGKDENERYIYSMNFTSYRSGVN